jgi:membrane protein
MKSRRIAKTSWNLLKTTYDEFDKDNAIKLSASLSYFTIFSLPPLLIIIMYVSSFFFG